MYITDTDLEYMRTKLKLHVAGAVNPETTDAEAIKKSRTGDTRRAKERQIHLKQITWGTKDKY